MPFPITDQADLYYRNETPRHASQNSGNRVYPSEGRFAAQPYITRDIGQRWGFNVGFDDGLVRGGIVTLVDRAANDVVRLTKFSLDLPKGPLFLAKQFGLQLMNPRFFLNPLPTPSPPSNSGGNYAPPSTGGSAGRSTRPTDTFIPTEENKINISDYSTLRLEFSDTQLYNPLSTVLQAGLTPLGLHFQRHSLPYIFPKYEELAKSSNGGIDNIKSISVSPSAVGSFTVESSGSLKYEIEEVYRPLNDPTKSKLVNLYVNHILYDWKTNSNLIEYPTGPGSMLGIGYTTIKRYDNTRKDVVEFTNKMFDKIIEVGSFNSEYNTGDYQTRIKLENSVRFSEQSGLFNDVTSSKSIELNSFGKQSPILNIASSSLGFNFEQDETNKTGNIQSRITTKPSSILDFNGSSINNQSVFAFTYNQISQWQSDSRNTTTATNYRDFRKAFDPEVQTLLRADDYTANNIHTRTGVMDTGLSNENENKVDQINVLDIYNAGSSKDVTNRELFGGGDEGTRNWVIQRDLIKFAFEPINNDTGGSEVITFRAYIKDFSDDYSAKWNSVDYVGRGEKFYTYEGFERKIKLSFTVFAHSKQEMKPIYRKLLYLFSQTAPDYSKSGYMRGPFVKLTIGNWFFRLPGFINSIGTSIDGKDTPWEIALNAPEGDEREDSDMLELPKLLEISLDFTPIHNFTPQKGTPLGLTPFLYLRNITGSVNWLNNTDNRKLKPAPTPLPPPPPPPLSKISDADGQTDPSKNFAYRRTAPLEDNYNPFEEGEG